MIILFVGVFFLLIFIVSSYNSLVKKRNQVSNHYGTMDVQMKKRHDLIPNLVGAVKTFMEHEKSLLEKLTSLRSKLESDIGKENREGLENEVSSTLGQFNITVENYPELKSNENMRQLQASLNEVEAQIAASRRVYNTAVTSYNDKRQVFPSNIVAGIFGFRAEHIYRISEAEKVNVNVTDLFKS